MAEFEHFPDKSESISAVKMVVTMRAHKVRVHLRNRRRERAALGAANLDALETHELDDRRHQLVKVVAALDELVEPREDDGVLELPRVVGHLLCGDVARLKVGGLERGTHLG